MGGRMESREELLEQIRALQRRIAELDRKVTAEERLKKEGIDFLEILQYLPDIVYRIDEDGRFTFVNDYVHVLGYSPSELIGKHFSTIIHPDDVPRVSRSHVLPRYHGKITGTERSPSLFDERRRFSRIRRGAEIRLLSKVDAGEAHGYVYIDAEVNAAGTYTFEKGEEIFCGSIGVIRDITLKKRSAEKMASLAEERYQNLLAKTNDPIVHVDRSGNVIFANSAFFAIFDTDIDSSANFEQFARTRLNEHSKKIFQSFWDLYSSSGIVKEIDELCWNVHGNSILYTEMIASVLKDADESFECLQLILRDITNKKMVEKALRESEELFRNLAEQSPLMIAMVEDSKVVYANKIFEKTLGFSRQELVNFSFDYYELFVPEFRHAIKKIHDKTLRHETAKEIECGMQGREGLRLDVIFSSGLIQYQGKAVLLDMILDITERKMLEEKTRKSQKLESLSVLAGGIAHDFNNILTVIMGNITLCRINPHDPDLVIKNLSAAEEAVSRARDLTRQFLAFSRNTAPLKKIMPLDGIIRDCVMFSSSGSQAKVDLCISEDLWPAEVDDGQIGQVLNNIIINAIQSMPHGGTLTVRASNKVLGEGSLLPLSAGNYIKITIKDTGSGIPPEDLSKIFDPYFTSKEMESGLGLAIAYSIVAKHGGIIDVESETGKGSAFSVYLPALPEAKDVNMEIAQVSREGKVRILIMDDDEGVIAVVTQFLSYLGYEYETAQDGNEAIERYSLARKENSPFHAVILDLTVTGGIGGKETVAMLKEIDPSVRAILATGYLDDPVVVNYHDHGFVDLIKKPFRIEELSRVLHRVIS